MGAEQFNQDAVEELHPLDLPLGAIHESAVSLAFHGLHDLALQLAKVHETIQAWLIAVPDSEAEAIRRIEALGDQAEADRTAVCDAVKAIERELNSRSWLRDSRGSYAWDDDRYRDEFGAAWDAIQTALKPLKRVAANMEGCPQDSAGVARARELRASAEHLVAVAREVHAGDEAALVALEELGVQRSPQNSSLVEKLAAAIKRFDVARVTEG